MDKHNDTQDHEEIENILNLEKLYFRERIMPKMSNVIVGLVVLTFKKSLKRTFSYAKVFHISTKKNYCHLHSMGRTIKAKS